MHARGGRETIILQVMALSGSQLLQTVRFSTLTREKVRMAPKL